MEIERKLKEAKAERERLLRDRVSHLAREILATPLILHNASRYKQLADPQNTHKKPKHVDGNLSTLQT